MWNRFVRHRRRVRKPKRRNSFLFIVIYNRINRVFIFECNGPYFHQQTNRTLQPVVVITASASRVSLVVPTPQVIGSRENCAL